MRNKTLVVLLIIQIVISFFIAYQVNDIKDSVGVLKNLDDLAGGDNQPNQPDQPSQPTNIKVDVKGDPFKGNKDAKVTIVEFSDFQCPFCSRFYEQTFPQLEKEYINTGKVKLVFKDFPLRSIHPLAQKASEAAECADEQGKFWEYHDKLFEAQQEWRTSGIDSFKQYASDLGLDTEKFNNCLDNDETKDEVDEDYNEALKAGGRGTPYFVINGKPLSGAQPFANFKAIIDAELK